MMKLDTSFLKSTDIVYNSCTQKPLNDRRQTYKKDFSKFLLKVYTRKTLVFQTSQNNFHLRVICTTPLQP